MNLPRFRLQCHCVTVQFVHLEVSEWVSEWVSEGVREGYTFWGTAERSRSQWPPLLVTRLACDLQFLCCIVLVNAESHLRLPFILFFWRRWRVCYKCVQLIAVLNRSASLTLWTLQQRKYLSIQGSPILKVPRLRPCGLLFRKACRWRAERSVGGNRCSVLVKYEH